MTTAAATKMTAAKRTPEQEAQRLIEARGVNGAMRYARNKEAAQWSAHWGKVAQCVQDLADRAAIKVSP